MIKRQLALAFAIAMTVMMLAVTGVCQSVDGGERVQTDRLSDRAQESLSRELAGSWNIAGETLLQDRFRALITFTSDGALIADEPPSPFESSGHGNWVMTGRNKAAYTFHALIGSAAGQLTGSIKVLGRLRYSPAQDTWTGPFQVQVFDSSGNVVFSDSGTFTGTRIQVEPLN